MKKSTIILFAGIVILITGLFQHNMTSVVIALGSIVLGLLAGVSGIFEIEEEENMENKPIDMVVEMLKESQKEINTLVKSYESGKMPPAELVARTFEIGKMFMGWQGEMPDDEALALIKEENKQIQAYLNKRKMQS